MSASVLSVSKNEFFHRGIGRTGQSFGLHLVVLLAKTESPNEAFILLTQLAEQNDLGLFFCFLDVSSPLELDPGPRKEGEHGGGWVL